MDLNSSEELQENTCVVCFKGVEIFSIGQCDHPVCYECSTRMRVLCGQNECPICRQDMPKVIFTKTVQPYNSLKNINGSIDKQFKIVFETEDEKKAYNYLLAHECPKCSKAFVNFSSLWDHIRRVHQLNYCDLCVDNLMIYSRERRCYSRSELARHRKEGDPDDRSHRGHPLCEFCDTRYMDTDELYRHLRRDHLYCHFCDADGFHHYYSSYEFLRNHFRAEHFLCEEGDCINEKFTAVFRSEIDLKAHRATVHGRGLGKAGLKQARTLELEFTLAPRPRPVHSRPRHRDEENGGDLGGGMSVAEGLRDEETARPGSGAPARDTPELRREEDFPALGSDPPSTSLSLRLTSAKQPSVSIHTSIQVNHPRFTTKVTSRNNYNYHFPALESSGGGEAGVTSVSWSACSGLGQSRGRAGGEQRAPPLQTGHLPPPPEAFPFLATVPAPSRISTATQSDPPTTRTPSTPSHQSAPSAKPPSLQPNPADPKPSQTTTKSKKKKSKAGKTTSEANPPLPSSNHSSVSAESKSKKNKKEQKLEKDQNQEVSKINNNDVENINHNNSVESIIKAMAIMTEKQRTSHLKEETKQGEDDFPTLGAPPGFEAGVLPRPSDSAPRWEIKKPTKPPPGLAKPPVSRPPPGFSGLNGGFPPLTGGPGGEDTGSTSNYITPTNFNKRNTSLVKLIHTSLVGETLDEFKQISVAFRNGSLAGPEYYAHCRQMLGPANFRELFPELLALLPDIDKQQDLWKIYKMDKSWSESSSGKKKKVEECATCGQILRPADLREHLSRHTAPATASSAAQLPNPWAKLTH